MDGWILWSGCLVSWMEWNGCSSFAIRLERLLRRRLCRRLCLRRRRRRCCRCCRCCHCCRCCRCCFDPCLCWCSPAGARCCTVNTHSLLSSFIYYRYLSITDFMNSLTYMFSAVPNHDVHTCERYPICFFQASNKPQTPPPPPTHQTHMHTQHAHTTHTH